MTLKIGVGRLQLATAAMFLLVGLVLNAPAGASAPPQGSAQQQGSENSKSVQQEEPGEATDEEAVAEVYAVVEGKNIGPAEVLFLLERLTPVSGLQKVQLQRWLESTDKKQTVQDRVQSLPTPLREAATSQWIERLLVLSYLRAAGYAPGESQLDSQWKEQCQEALKRGEDLPAELEKRGLTESTYRDHLAWEQAWSEYLRAKVNEDTLRKYYELRSDRFDGTQLRVAQIFLPCKTVDDNHPATAEPSVEDKAKCLELGKHLFKQIQNNTLSFSEAARKFSQGSSAARGGEMGWIDFDGPLLPELTEVAFNTAVGECSPPVSSPLGTHLLTVLERKPGAISFEERIDRIRVAAVKDLWNNLVKQQRERVSVNIYSPGEK